MKKIGFAAFLSVTAWFYSTVIFADSLLLRADYPERYVVVKGDTLWDIAGRFLKNPWDWPEIWQKNTDIVEDPHWIYPGEVLFLRFDADGNLYLTRDVDDSGLSTVRLSPELRLSDLDQIIPTVSLDVIQPFINKALVYPAGFLDSAPYIFAHEEDEIVGDKGEWSFARGSINDWALGQAFQIVRKNKTYYSPDDETIVLGEEVELIGQAIVENIRNGVAAIEITENVVEVRKGDRLVPIQYTELESNFVPTASLGSARLIEGITAMKNMSIFDAAVIDYGKYDGAQEGHVFEIYDKYNEQAFDEFDANPLKEAFLLPQKRKGLAMVFKVFDNVSYVLIMESLKPIKKGDWLGSPQ